MQVIGLHIGGSFAEASVWAAGEREPRAQTLFYLPRHNLKTALPRFLKTLPDQNFSAAFMTSRHLERLFEFRLGGSTAQLVTAGFERWPFIDAAPVKAGWVCPIKSHPISSLDLSFAVDERIEADGRVSKPLDVQSLTPIADKLKLQQIKRVCIHFMHADRHPTHEDLAATWLRDQGFEVFLPPRTPGLSEGSRWRAGTLEASFSGTYEEQSQDVTIALAEYLPESAVKIHDGEGFKALGSARKVGTLFGDDALLARGSAGRKVLRLDLETWSLLDGKSSSEWESPWGAVACPGPKRRMLAVQPTCALESCGGGLVSPSERAEGFEPGPLSLGRGQKLMVFDLWSDDPSLRAALGEQLPESARSRRDSALLALSRESKSRSKEAFEAKLKADVELWIRTDVATQTDFREMGRSGRMASTLSGLNEIPELALRTAADRAALAGLEDA